MEHAATKPAELKNKSIRRTKRYSAVPNITSMEVVPIGPAKSPRIMLKRLNLFGVKELLTLSIEASEVPLAKVSLPNGITGFPGSGMG